MVRHGTLQDIGQCARRSLERSRGVDLVDRPHEAPDSAAVQCGHERHGYPRREHQAAVEALPDLGALGGGEAVPLVDHQHDPGPRVRRVADQVQVLLDDALPGVDEHEGDVGAVQRVEGLDDRELLHEIRHAAPAAHAGGVDQDVGSAVPLERRLDGVPRGSGLVGNHLPLVTEQPVDEGGFAHVRTPHDGDPGARRVGLCLRSVVVREALGHGLPQRRHPPALRRGDHEGRPETQPREVPDGGLGRDPVDLVGDEQHRRAALAQVRDDLLVARREPVTRVDQEDDECRFADRRMRLCGHDRRHGALVAHEAPGVDQGDSAPVEVHVSVAPVAGEPRTVGHQRVPRSREPVEQGGFPDVGAPHQRDDGHPRRRISTASSRPPLLSTYTVPSASIIPERSPLPSILRRATKRPSLWAITCR